MSPGISAPALPSASPTGAQFPSAANTDADKPAINPTAIVYLENHIRIFLLYSVEVSPLPRFFVGPNTLHFPRPRAPLIVCASRPYSASLAQLRDHLHRSGRQPLGADVGWTRTP